MCRKIRCDIESENFHQNKKIGIRILVGVDTVFGHVSLGAYLDLMRYRSAGRRVVDEG